MSLDEGDTKSPPGDNSGGSDTPPVMAAVSVKLPPFWRADPQIWFAQAEAQFDMRNITAESTKYVHVIAVLQPDIAQEVRDLLIERPKDQPYTKLKAQLIQRTTASEQQRVQMLLTEEELGDRKPSQLLRRMEQLVGEQKLDKGILKQLFLQRLPPNIRLILASTSDAITLTALAELADRILEVHIPTLGAISPSGATAAPVAAPATAPAIAAASVSSPGIDDLRDEIRKMSKTLHNLQVQVGKLQRNSNRGRSKSPSRARGANPGKPGESGAESTDLCFYHARFGDKATKCTTPCSRSAEFSGNDPTSR